MAFGGEKGVPAQGGPRSPLERFGIPDLVLRLQRDRSLGQQLRKVREVVDQHGRAGFVTYGLWGRRRCYQLRDRLPAGYEALIEDPNPEGGGPGALYRWVRQEVRLWVTRVGGPDRQPRSEDPHQRALNSLNRPNPPEQDNPGR